MNMSQDQQTVEFGPSGEIICPHCGRYYDMHVSCVRVFMRGEDDTKGGYSALVKRESAVVQTGAAHGNPSSRREGLTVEFECACGNFSLLALAQHKGPTYARWVSPENPSHWGG